MNQYGKLSEILALVQACGAQRGYWDGFVEAFKSVVSGENVPPYVSPRINGAKIQSCVSTDGLSIAVDIAHQRLFVDFRCYKSCGILAFGYYACCEGLLPIDEAKRKKYTRFYYSDEHGNLRDKIDDNSSNGFYLGAPLEFICDRCLDDLLLAFHEAEKMWYEGLMREITPPK